MPINRLAPSRRGLLAIAAAISVALGTGWASLTGSAPATPQEVHQAVDAGATPPAVQLAADALIRGWEGTRLIAYQDVGGVWTICYGETLGVTAGMRKTQAECEAMLKRRLTHDFYLRLVDNVRDYVVAPVGVQAALLSLSYNIGVARAWGSTAAVFIVQHKYREACDAMTRYNRAAGVVVAGLVARREMGDASRIGEGEICVSGLQ